MPVSFDAHANLAVTTVAVAPSPATTGGSLTVAAGAGALFPAAPFNATVWPVAAIPSSANAEIVRVTAVLGDALSITRTQEGTSARSIGVGDQIAATITAKTLTDIEGAVPSLGAGTNFSGTNITGTLNTSGLSLSVAAPGAGGLTNVKVSAGTLSALRSDLTFANGSGVSFGLDTAGNLTATVATNYQSSGLYQPAGAYLTTAMLSNASSTLGATGFSSTTTAGTAIVGTNNTSGLSLGVPAFLTTADLSANSSKYAGLGATTATTAGTAVVATLNTTGLSLGIPAFLTTADLSANSSKYAGTGYTSTTQAGTSLGVTLNTSGLSLAQPPFLTTAMASNAATITAVNLSAGTTSTNATAFTFSNSNSISFGMGTGASAGVITASISVTAAPSPVNVTVPGSSGNLQTIAFSNGSGVSWGLNGSTITASVAAGGGAGTGYTSTTQAGTSLGVTLNAAGLSLAQPPFLTTAMASNAATITAVNLSAGTTSTNASAFTFSNSNGVSFGLSSGAGAGVVTGSIATTYAGTGFTSTTTAGTAIVGTNNTSGLSLGVPAFLTTADLSANSSKYAGIGYTSTTQAGATVGMTLNTSGLSAAWPPFLTTADLSGNSSNYAGTHTSVATTAGSDITLGVNTSGVTIGYPKYLTTAALSANTSNYGGVGVTTTTQAGSTVGMTLNTTGLSVAWPPYLTTADLSANSSKYAGLGVTTTTTAGTAVVGTLNTTGLSLGVPAMLTTALASNAYTSLGGTGFTSTSTAGSLLVGTMGSNGLSVGVPAWLTVAAGAGAAISASGSSQNAGTIVFSNSNNVSFGMNGSTITATVTGAGGAGDGYNIVSLGTTGTTGTAWSSLTATVGINGSGGVTVSQNNSNQIVISAPPASSLVATGGISLASAGSTISISQFTLPNFEPEPLFNGNSTTYAPGIGSWHMAPVMVPMPIAGGRLNMMVAHGSTASILRESSTNFSSASTGTYVYTFGYSRFAALYSLGAGTNSTRLESQWSNMFSLSIQNNIKVATGGATTISVSESASLGYILSIDSNGAYTTTQLTTSQSASNASGSTSVGSTMMTSVLSSWRNLLSSQLMIPIGFNTTINPGLWYLGMMWSTSSSTATTGALTTANVLSIVNQYAIYGATNTAARMWGQTAATSGSVPFPGAGVYSAASAAPPATMAFSDIRTMASQPMNYFNIVNSVITV